MDSHDVFSTETAGLADVAPTGLVRLHDGDRLELWHRPGAQDASTTPSCGCSPTTGRSPARPCTSSRGRRSPCRCGTTATSRRPCTGTACGWRTATTASRTRPRSRSRSAATYTCQVQFPDAGFYWYHPHMREDFAQEMGLYGTIVVEPADPAYWPAVDRELTLTLDDLLVEDGHIAPFSRSGPTFTAMGRFGNVLLINGETRSPAQATVGRGRAPVPGQHREHPDLQLRRPRRPDEAGRRRQRPVRARDVHRGGPARAVGAGGRRRAVRRPRRGAAGAPHPGPRLRPRRVHRVTGRRGAALPPGRSTTLRTDPELTAEHQAIGPDLDRAPDKVLAFVSRCRCCTAGTTRRRPPTPARCTPRSPPTEPATCPTVRDEAGASPCLRLPDAPEVTAPSRDLPECGMKLCPDAAPRRAARAPQARPRRRPGVGGPDAGDQPGVGSGNMIWQLIDRETGAVNGAIDWAFTVGDRVKIRLVNEMDSDHPMHHPFHVHGAGRFLVLSRDGVAGAEPGVEGHRAAARRARPWTSCSTSPTPGCGWRTATSPSTPRAA